MESSPDFSSPDYTPHQELNYVDLRDVIGESSFQEHVQDVLYKVGAYPMERSTIMNDFIDDLAEDNEFIGDIFHSKIDYIGFDYSDVDETEEPELCAAKGASLQGVTIRDVYHSPTVIFKLLTTDENNTPMTIDVIPTTSNVAQFTMYSEAEHKETLLVDRLREAAIEAQRHVTSPEFLVLTESEQEMVQQSIASYIAEKLRDIQSPVMEVWSAGYYQSESPYLDKNFSQADYHTSDEGSCHTRGELIMIALPESRTYLHNVFRSINDFSVSGGIPYLLFSHNTGTALDYHWIPLDELHSILPQEY